MIFLGNHKKSRQSTKIGKDIIVHYFRLLCLFTLLLYGCNKDSPTGPFATGKFVVDSIMATSTGGIINTTYSSIISCTINYHYEILTGTIDYVIYVVGTDTVKPTRVAAYYQPEPVSVPLNRRENFWYPRHLTEHDSVYAHFFLYGRFWSRISRDSVTYYGPISVEDSVMIVVQN